MGSRGPLQKPTSRRTRAKSGHRTPDLATERQISRLSVAPPTIPPAPRTLRAAGKRVWLEFWACPWAQDSDSTSIRLLAELEDERSRILAAVGHDLTLERPIVSPKGDVVGQELVAHPLLRDLRRLDPAIVQLRDRLGLTPMARGRLGQQIVAQTRAGDPVADQIMAGYRDRARAAAKGEKA